MKIDITKITNPIVRRALQERSRDFMFNYADATNASHVDEGYGHEHSDYYNDQHNDHHTDSPKHDIHDY